MIIVCLDLEGVLVPEIWVELAEKAGIEGLKRTTRDEPDYDVLMNYRLDLLRENGLTLPRIQEVIEEIEPMPGAREFLDSLREEAQVIIVSDTFNQFIRPLLPKLGMPTVFCNDLIVDEDGTITGYKMRCDETKKTTVRALHDCGFGTIASGDSYNDVGMIMNSKAGFFFRTTDKIKQEYPDVPALETYDELYAAITKALRD